MGDIDRTCYYYYSIMDLLGLCETARGQGGLRVRGALQTWELQHVHLYIRHMTR